MSIFQGTLDKFVQDQLKAREIIISQGTYSNGVNTVTPYGSISRSDSFLRYTTGKNSWVRMVSFVDVNKTIGGATYSGNQLAKKYILEGGVLYENSSGQYSLRHGVGKNNAVYGSNIDKGGNRPLGYRPMPGITSAQIVNKSAYGSLREVTVKFYCWDKHQLEELELLYMRTGYSVLLEWGWSQYLNSSNLNDIKIENFNSPTIDVFNIKPNPKLSPDEVIYRQIETLNQSTYGNYDGMLGYIKNFSWQIMPNGGYDCTTVLISRGEVISSVKVSSNTNSSDLTGGAVNVPTLSQFEQLLFNYSALVNGSETKSGGQFSYVPPSGGGVGSGNPLSNQITTGTVSSFLSSFQKINNEVTLFDDRGAEWNSVLRTELSTGANNYGGCTLLTEGTTYQNGGYGIEYIRLDIFIALLNFYFNFKDENNKLIADIRIPNHNVCLASQDTVSVDPTTCIIKNTKATQILLQGSGGAGFDPKVVLGDYDPSTGNVTTVVIKEFLKNNNRGYISNIYLAIPKLIEIYRSKMQGDSDVITTEYLKEVLNQVSRALGGINNFQLHTTKSASQIIDVKYLEEGSTSSNKYEFDLLGLKSICRDIKIQSRVFESQSTMMAIAAQNSSNVGDLYSSTQVYLNQGLTDRLIPKKGIYNDGSSKSYEEQVYNTVANLGYYLRTKVLADPSLTGGFIPTPPPTPTPTPPPPTPPPPTPTPPPATPPTNIQRVVIPKPEEISNAVSALKTYLYQVKGHELQYKAIIPFELEITLDGIAGCVQGQIFKINENILPDAYVKSGIGFIITGISHSLQNNDWVTVIKTQICVLDADSKQAIAPKISIKTLQKIAVANQEASYIIFAIADYLTEIFVAAALKEQVLTRTTPDKYVNVGGTNIIVKGSTTPATKFTDVINDVRTGNLKDFNTYLNYWHPKELAAVGSSASAIKFPSTIAKMLNPTGNAADKFDTSWVDTLVYDEPGRIVAIPGGTTVSQPPIKGTYYGYNVYRKYSFLERKDPNSAVAITNSAGAPGGSEITALATAGKSNLDVLIHNAQQPSTDVMSVVTAAYDTIIDYVKMFPDTTTQANRPLIPGYNGIIAVNSSGVYRKGLGGVLVEDLTINLYKPALRNIILSYLQQLMGTNQKVPVYSRPISFPDLSKIVPISYDPANINSQSQFIKTIEVF